MNLHEIKRVHLVGVGGINMSAVAKLLLASGVSVSGSDLAANEQTDILKSRGAAVTIGEAAENIPADTELLIYTSAAPATNKERIGGAARNIPEMTNFTFLGEWFADAKTIVVTGTHGKSTTTAMLGLALERAGMDPTVVVGSKVPGFADGNLRLGRKDLFVVEGDEYARHFLEFHPTGVILNNLELDHTDVFHSIEALIQSFHELVGQVKDGGVVVANMSDERIARLVETERETLAARGIRIVTFAGTAGEWNMESHQADGSREMSLTNGSTTYRYILNVPGHFNALNAAGASLMARELGAPYEAVAETLTAFHGIWRRFESLGEHNGALVYSDYGHHPTAVKETLKAAHESFPDRRIVLCFQPHHRNRTRSLFLEFVPSFDAADGLVLCEIYDVKGRDDAADENISSHDLVDAIVRHDADRGVTRTVEYAPNPTAAIEQTFAKANAGDVVIVMGAGDIDGAVRKAMAT